MPEYTVVLTAEEVKFIRELTKRAALTMPPGEFSDWVKEELPYDSVVDFYYTFIAPSS